MQSLLRRLHLVAQIYGVIRFSGGSTVPFRRSRARISGRHIVDVLISRILAHCRRVVLPPNSYHDNELHGARWWTLAGADYRCGDRGLLADRRRRCEASAVSTSTRYCSRGFQISGPREAAGGHVRPIGEPPGEPPPAFRVVIFGVLLINGYISP